MLQNMLVQVKLKLKIIPKQPTVTALFLCNNCVYHKACYIPCSSFSFKLAYIQTVSQTYKNYFSCDSKDVIYILICKTYDNFYLRQLNILNKELQTKSQMSKPQTCSTCSICLEHLRDCKHAEPYFQITKQILGYENMKRVYSHRWKLTLI